MSVKAAPAPQGPTKAAVKHYDAARQDRLTNDWQVSRLSADAELQGKLPIIRARSRDAERNEPLAENFLFLSENNIIGHAGIRFESKVVQSQTVDAKTGEVMVTYDAPINREIERAWKLFRQRDNFLTTRNMDAVAAGKLIVRTIRRDSDCLIRKVRGYPNRFGFALQLLEPDFLDDQYIDFRGVPCDCPNERRLPDGRPFPYCQSGIHQVRMGVELHGDWMFPVAYWILADHPGDYFFGNQFSVRRTRVPVEDMIHPFIVKRMGQTRGVPALVAAMLRLEMLGGYDEATLVKARAAAQKIGFLEKEIPDSIADQFADTLGDRVPTMDSEPGGILDLPPGVKFKEWDPQDPSPQYDPYTKQQTRMIACAGGVSYTSLSNNIEAVNFSSIRSGLLEEREGWKGGQGFYITEVERPIFEAWLPMAILSGECQVPMSRVEEFTAHDVACFHGRRWPWVDPLKDVQASIAAVEAGLKTRSQVIGESDAGDFEEVTAGLEREQNLRVAAGIATPPQEPGDDGSLTADPEDKPGPDDDAPVKRWDPATKRWVTINGTHVDINPDGTVNSGPAALTRHFGRKEAGPDGAKPAGVLGKVGGRELSADDFTHSSRAAANGHALHFLPASALERAWSKDPAHLPTAALGAAEKPGARAGFADFVTQGRPIEAAQVHVDEQGTASFVDGRHRTAVLRDAGMSHLPVTMTGASRRNAEAHGLFSTAQEPAKKRRSFQLPFAPAGAEDAIDHIVDQGGMASRKTAQKRGHAGADYDDAPDLKGVYHHAVFGGTMRPDQMAQVLHQNHGIGDGSVGGLYDAIGDAITTRKAVQADGKRQAQQYQQANRFDKDALTPHKGDQAVHVGNLAVGDVLTIHGQKVRVKDIDPDTMDVTLQDHSRYGAQTVQDGQVLYVQHVEDAEQDGPF